MKKILVVGDWVVDEHWVTGIHRSSTSSRTGRAHYRTLHPLSSTIQSFCAAGRTASILHRSRLDSKNFCKIIGIGMWHKDDTEELAAMLDPIAVKEQTPHRLTRSTIKKENGASLFNLGPVVDRHNGYDQLQYSYGTTRVIRIYQNTGAKIELIERIDWELPMPSGETAWVRTREILKHDSELNEFFENNSDLDAVVIKDICKGVVSGELVGWLSSKLAHIPWFISTKAWAPDWFQQLSQLDVRLLFIPQIAAQKAIRSGIVNSWITRSGYASKDALDQMDRLAEEFRNNDRFPTIVVLPEGITVLACDFNESEKKGILQTEPEPSPLPVGIPMASVFFPAVVANLLQRDNQEESSLQGLLKGALGFTQQWMTFEAQRVKKPEDWNPLEEPIQKVNPSKKYNTVGSWQPFQWNIAKVIWEEAFSSIGIIESAEKTNGKRCYLDLSRGMIDVEGYVCCVYSKRVAVRKLVQELGTFLSGGRRRSKSYMLIASPGSGKTFLVRSLAKSLGLRYLPFNITQMFSKSDILDCFDTIVTTQAQNPEETVLVFFDEIDAKIEGQDVYDTFLAPLEDSVYIRAGKTFHIGPCFWIFAGTQSPLAESGPGKQKASDFLSRLTIKPLSLKVDTSTNLDAVLLEKVYLGAALLRTTFPDVRRISEKVLTTFHMVSLGLEVREIKHFVRSFVDIQNGEVLDKNVPMDQLADMGIDVKTWNAMPEGRKVEIVG